MYGNHSSLCNCSACSSVHEVARRPGYRIVRTQSDRLDGWDRHDFGWEEQQLRCPETGDRYYAILERLKTR